jgi:hypothetical protein
MEPHEIARAYDFIDVTELAEQGWPACGAKRKTQAHQAPGVPH